MLVDAEELLELVQQEAADDPRCRGVTIRGVRKLPEGGWTAVFDGAGQEGANAMAAIVKRLARDYQLA